MSDIFLNYVDVRSLFARLARLSHADETATMAGIAEGIGLADFEVFPRLKLPPAAVPGVNLDTSTISNLLTCTRKHDLPNMRNTDRLEEFCAAFGWKADAMMHFLKSTTAAVGRNVTLKFDWSNNNDLWVNDAEEAFWLHQFKRGTGLYIIAAPPGHGSNQTMCHTVAALEASGIAVSPAPIPGYIDFDGENPSAEYLSGLDDRLARSSVLYGQAFDDRGVHMALHFAATKIVILILQADSSHAALNLVRRHGRDAVDQVRALMAMRRFFEPHMKAQPGSPLRSISARTFLDTQNAPEHTYWPKPFNGHLFHIGTAITGLAAHGLITAERASELVQFEVERKLVPGDVAIGGEHYSSFHRSSSQSPGL
jgi:hypothetical protein